MPKSALPPHLLVQAGWIGTDWDTWYQRWMIKFKGCFAYGPRASQWWAKWREWPITLFAVRSKAGMFRIETETYERDSSRESFHNRTGFVYENNVRAVFWEGKEREIVPAYLSAIQYWTKWHVQLQWPLFVAFHYYIDDVPEYPEHAGRRRVFFFRLGARRDADKVYWLPSFFVGLQWN